MAALAGREDPLSFEALAQRAARASKGSDDPLIAELGVLEELQSLRLKGASKRLEEAEKRKAKGNAAFQRGETDKAMRSYLEALWLLRPLPAFDSMPPCDRSLPCGFEAAAFLGERADGLSPKHKLLRALHGNVCACALKREDWALAVLSAEHVLTSKTCPTKEWRLAVRRRAKAVSERGVGEVEWTQKAPPVPAPPRGTRQTVEAGDGLLLLYLEDVEARRDAGTHTKKEAAEPGPGGGDGARRGPPRLRAARGVRPCVPAINRASIPEDGKDVAF